MAHYWTQTLMGCIGAVGFAVLFNVRGKRLWLIALASAMSWLGYVLCDYFGAGLFWAIFCGTTVAGMLSEILARVVKAPVLMLLVPILIPLILSSMERIETISNAMELRGFGKEKKRSWYSGRKFSKLDIACMVGFALLMVASFAITYFNGGRYFNPFLK